MRAELHKCPVCLGTGTVSNGFYSSTTGSWSSTDTGVEDCRSCFGTGVICYTPTKGIRAT